MILQVDTVIGPNGFAEPHSFQLGSARVAVIDIVDRWIAADHSYFKIEASDGATYILRHDEALSLWHLTLYRAPPG